MKNLPNFEEFINESKELLTEGEAQKALKDIKRGAGWASDGYILNNFGGLPDKVNKELAIALAKDGLLFAEDDLDDASMDDGDFPEDATPMTVAQAKKLLESEIPVFEKAGKPLDFVTAAKEFNKKLKSMGVKARPLTPGDLESADATVKGDSVVVVDEIKINPKTLGALAPVFEFIDLKVTAIYGEVNQVIVLLLEYQWQHPSGSNGYSVRDSFWDGKWVGY